MKNLVEIDTKKFDVILDLRYATTNNVCGVKLYSYPFCYLHQAAIKPFETAIQAAKNLGLKLKIFDCFRPLEVQKFMFEKFPCDDPNGGFISNPESGAVPHCRGVAIDLTLVDGNENELNMGTDFDEFSDLAFHNCKKVSLEAQRNRLILLGLMTIAGFDFYANEWWHYQLFKPREYPIISIS
jgi:D-alanyl-D-alanine dipeptidase